MINNRNLMRGYMKVGGDLLLFVSRVSFAFVCFGVVATLESQEAFGWSSCPAGMALRKEVQYCPSVKSQAAEPVCAYIKDLPYEEPRPLYGEELEKDNELEKEEGPEYVRLVGCRCKPAMPKQTLKGCFLGTAEQNQASKSFGKEAECTYETKDYKFTDEKWKKHNKENLGYDKLINIRGFTPEEAMADCMRDGRDPKDGGAWVGHAICNGICADLLVPAKRPYFECCEKLQPDCSNFDPRTRKSFVGKWNKKTLQCEKIG